MKRINNTSTFFKAIYLRQTQLIEAINRLELLLALSSNGNLSSYQYSLSLINSSSRREIAYIIKGLNEQIKLAQRGFKLTHIRMHFDSFNFIGVRL